MEKSYVKINCFDDGRAKYIRYVNKWVILEKKFNGGKFVLKNAVDNQIIINSISSWKTVPFDDEPN